MLTLEIGSFTLVFSSWRLVKIKLRKPKAKRRFDFSPIKNC